MPYCSKICCMCTAKHAIPYQHRAPDGQVYVFYMDIRAGAKVLSAFQAAQARERWRKPTSLLPSDDEFGAREAEAPVAAMEAA